MGTPGVLHRWTTAALQLQALTLLPVLAVLVQGRNHLGDAACPSFSCGPLVNLSAPFRRGDDPTWCGVKSCELACTEAKAMVRIADATYYVSGINHTDSTVWVVDVDLDLHSSCPRFTAAALVFLGGTCDLLNTRNTRTGWKNTSSGSRMTLEPT